MKRRPGIGERVQTYGSTMVVAEVSENELLLLSAHETWRIGVGSAMHLDATKAAPAPLAGTAWSNGRVDVIILEEDGLTRIIRDE